MHRLLITLCVLLAAPTIARACDPCHGCEPRTTVTIRGHPERGEAEWLAILRDPSQSPSLRRVAAIAIGNLAQPGSTGLQALIALLDDPHEDYLRGWAPHALEHAGARAAEAAVPLAFIVHRDPERQHDARDALLRITGEQDLSSLAWTVPRIYGERWLILGLALVLWVGIGARALRKARGRDWRYLPQLIYAGTVLPAVAVAWLALELQLKRSALFLPETYLGLLPFAVTARLSLGVACAVLTVWLRLQLPAPREVAVKDEAVATA